jgi:hypothetical protein
VFSTFYYVFVLWSIHKNIRVMMGLKSVWSALDMNVPGIVWPTTYSKERVLKIAKPSRINWPDDYRDMVEGEDSFDF